MSRQKSLVLLGVLVLTAGAGCLQSMHQCCSCCEPPPELTLPIVQRGNMEALFQGLPALLPDEALPGSAPEVVGTYFALMPKDCQCLAVRCCGVANLLARERSLAGQLAKTKCLVCGQKAQKGAAFLQETIDSGAHDARNQQAGGALELYYRLAEAEAGSDLLQATLRELDEALEKGKDLRAKMLITDEEYARMERQRYKALSDRTELQMNIETLNVELSKLLCVPVCPGQAHLWPLVDLEAGCPEIDCEAAVRVALQTRGELKILRGMLRELDIMTVPGIREGM